MRSTMPITDARRKCRTLRDRAERGERIVITRYGKPFVAFVPFADLQVLNKLKRDSKDRLRNRSDTV